MNKNGDFMCCRLVVIAVVILSLLAGCGNDKTTSPTPVTSLIETVLIPAGTFQMGNTGAFKNNGYDNNEHPVHSVTISRSFLMSKTEITQKEYMTITGHNPSEFTNEDFSYDDTFPVEQVSWADALYFCDELSKKEGLKPCYELIGDSLVCDWDANGWRLPTEAEWEYACKAGTTTDYYISDLKKDMWNIGDTNLTKIAYYDGWGSQYGGGGFCTTNVGGLLPNNFGLYDMLGNVYEWCWDWYQEKYYTNQAVKDPKGPRIGDYQLRDDHVVRGGSFISHVESCRSSCRFHSRGFESNIGFRIVRNK